MRAKLTFLLSLVFILSTLSAVSAQTVPEYIEKYEIVVELEPGQDVYQQSAYFLSQLDVPEDQAPTRLNHVYKYALNGYSVFLTLDELDRASRLLASGDMVGTHSITLSQAVSIPVLTGPDGAMPETRLLNGYEVVPSGLTRIDAAPKAGEDFSNVDIAVIDTGVDKYHQDLNVVDGTDCTKPKFDPLTGSPNVVDRSDWGYDGYGHGTHVAGTIAARDNGQGVVGVAPGARIWSVRVLDDSGSGTFAAVICGIDYVAEHGDQIEIANMSLGGSGVRSTCGGDDPMHNAICVATEQTVFVVAAGNSNSDSMDQSPANYPEVITVSAFTDFDGQPGSAGMPPGDRCAAMSVDDELAAFSNYGEDVDIAAPGVCTLSTLPSTENPEGGRTPLYGYASGTSMATPHVAGALARFLALNPDQREFARKQLITWSAANSQPIPGDHDSIHEPLLYVGQGVPRYEGPIDPAAEVTPLPAQAP